MTLRSFDTFSPKVASFNVFTLKCKIPTIDFCIECQNFTIQSQPNGGEIWVSSNLVEREEEEGGEEEEE